MTPSPRLSVCMIVRNEEKALPACLHSLRGVADELVVVDTGSTDGTLALLEDFGARVFHHPWENDFSKHRNQCLSYATGDWIFQVDADERLHEESAGALRRLLAASPAAITNYLVEIHDCDQRGRRRNFFLFPRLFRNNAGASYSGAVHNQLSIPGARGRSRIGLDHVGYHLDPATMQRKFERTRDLLLQQLARDPNDASAVLNLALVHAMHKNIDGVIEFGERLAARLDSGRKLEPVFFPLYHPLAAAHLSRGNHQRAEALARSALRLLPDFPDGHHVLTWVALLQKDYLGVLTQGAAFKESLQSWQSRFSASEAIECQTLARGCEVDCWMGMAQIARGQLSTGLASLEKAFKDSAFDEHTALTLIRLMGEIKPEMLMEWGPQCIQLFSDDLDFVFAALSVLQQSGGLSVMRYCLAVLDAKHLPATGAPYQRALLHLLREEYQLAADLLSRVDADSPHHAEAQRQLRYCRERMSSAERQQKVADAPPDGGATVFVNETSETLPSP